MFLKRTSSDEAPTGRGIFVNCQSKVIDKEKGIRVAPDYDEKDSIQDIQPISTVLQNTIEANKNEPCFGIRSDFSSEAEWMTYGEFGLRLKAVAAGLSQIVGNGNRFVGIQGRNLPEWIISQHACGSCGLVSVPLYDTLGREAIQHIFKQTELRNVICDTVARAQSLISWITTGLNNLIVMRSDDAELERLRGELRGSIRLWSFAELMDLGNKCTLEEKIPDLDSPCIICYTSGSTGVPKGAIHTQRSFATTISLIENNLPPRTWDGSRQTHLSYLPLSHIMEQLILSRQLTYGSRIGFLTTDISGLQKDIQYYRPTLFCAVPRILTRLHSEFLKHFRDNFFAKLLLNIAISAKLREQKKEIYSRSGWLDRKLLAPVRERFGGRVEMIVCGSAPLPSEVLLFVKAAFSCPVLEGYGTTETGGMVSLTIASDQQSGHVGSVVRGVRVQLTDVPSMDIKVSRDKMGEICVMSGGCSPGYYKDEQNTKELFTEDGYVRTGDIGCWTNTGALRIIDRCKNMFKLSQGEYIAPEKIERIYSQSPLVQSVFVDGNSSSSFAIGIVVPDCQQVWQQFSDVLAPVFKISNTTTEDPNDSSIPVSAKDLCKNSVVADIILRELNALGKRAGLSGFEQVKAIHLCPEPFTIANGLLTPTMKASRPQIRRHYAAAIEELYRKTGI